MAGYNKIFVGGAVIFGGAGIGRGTRTLLEGGGNFWEG